LLGVVPAFAGTATINFDANTGLLTYKAGGAGALTTAVGRASFSGSNITLLAQSGTPISSSGTTSITMTLQPSTDAVNGVGLIMTSPDGFDQVTAIVSDNGDVVLTDYIGNQRMAHFTYPAAGNNYLTLTYDAAQGRATLSLNGGAQEVYLYDALEGATSVRVGVIANGPGGFESFSGTGPGIPDYPPPVQDSDGDGVNDDDETAAGTDPHDPGNLPVYNAQGATVHALNGATVVIPAGSLPSSSINVAVSGAGPAFPIGNVPDGKALSRVGLELKPDGTTFTAAVTVTLPYTGVGIQGLIESSLDVVYFQGPDYANAGIANVAVNTGNHSVTFTTTHFTTFVLAGQPRDTDGDGIDDWWEMYWFGDLTTANATSNYDGDGISDLIEFRYWNLGLNPKEVDAPLPVDGLASLAALGVLLTGAGCLVLRRSRAERSAGPPYGTQKSRTG
jgi:hypothetical protein